MVFTRTWRRRQPRLACGLPATPVARPRAPPEPSGGPCGVNNNQSCPLQVGPNDCCQPEPSVGPYQVPEVMEKIHMLETTFDCRPAVSSCSPESPTIQSSPPSTSVCGQTHAKFWTATLLSRSQAPAGAYTYRPAGRLRPSWRPHRADIAHLWHLQQDALSEPQRTDARAIGCAEGQDARPCPEGRAGRPGAGGVLSRKAPPHPGEAPTWRASPTGRALAPR